MLMHMLILAGAFEQRGSVHNSPDLPDRNPWDNVSLSKAERRGKSYQEQQALRKAIYEAR
jgi:hypothetical protein